MKKVEKRIDELKENEVFEFHSMPSVEFLFVKFHWRSDTLVFNPEGTTMLFETDKSCNDTVLVNAIEKSDLPSKQSSTFGGLGMGTF